MKTQKVEIEIPVFDGYEFVEYGLVKIKHDLDNYYIYVPDIRALVIVCSPHIGEFHFIYKKKNPRRIIFEEVGERKLKRGDYYCDGLGYIHEWKLPCESAYKYIAFKKIHDDFDGVNND